MLPLKSYPLHTPEQYLERERAAQERNEYHHGLIYALAGGTNAHAIIIQNCAFTLQLALSGRKCTTTGSDLKVAAPNQSSFFYADLVIRCNQSIPFDQDLTETPNVVIEVLSPSTRAYDWNTKRHVY